MPNFYFQFKQFLIRQEKSGMKVTTDGCLLGAWVAEHFHDNTVKQVLDIGTGTGLLTLMLAQKLHARFDAVEVNQDAFAEASSNFKNSPWSERIKSHHAPIQEFEADSKYDLIICNPPFFKGNQEGRSEAKNLAIHDQTLPMTDLLSAADRLLAETGKLAIMYPEWEMKQFSELAQGVGLWPEQLLNVYNHPDSNVFRVLAIYSRERRDATSTDLTIREGEEYSERFLELVKDYYL